MFYVKRCSRFSVFRRWCVFATAGDGTSPILIQDQHLTYSSAQAEADRLNA